MPPQSRDALPPGFREEGTLPPGFREEGTLPPLPQQPAVPAIQYSPLATDEALNAALGPYAKSPVVQGLVGFAKEGMRHVTQAGEAARKYIPGVAKLDQLMTPRDVNVTPIGGAQKVGSYIEPIAEFAVPGSAASKALEGEWWATRMLAQGAIGAGEGAYQSGGDRTATGLGAVLGAGSVPAGAVASRVAGAVKEAAAGAREGGLGGAIAKTFRMMSALHPKDSLTKAIRPRNSNLGFTPSLDLSIPEVAKSAAEMQTRITNPTELLDAVKNAKQRVWNQYHLIAGPKAQAGLDLSPVADAMVSSIPKKMWVQDEKGARKLVALANTYRDVFPMEDAESMLRTTNAELEALGNKLPPGQRAAIDADPATAHLVAEGKSLRNTIYGFLDRAGEGAGIRDLKGRYGALMNLEEETMRRANVAARQPTDSMSEQMSNWVAARDIAKGVWKLGSSGFTNASGLGDVAMGLAGRSTAKYLKEQQTTDALIRRTFDAAKDWRPTPVNIEPVAVRGALPRGAIPTGPVPDASFVRSVPGMRQQVFRQPELPEGRGPIRPAGPIPDPSGGTSVPGMRQQVFRQAELPEGRGPVRPMGPGPDASGGTSVPGMREFSGKQQALPAPRAIPLPAADASLPRGTPAQAMVDAAGTITYSSDPAATQQMRHMLDGMRDHAVDIAQAIKARGGPEMTVAEVGTALKELHAGKPPTNAKHVAVLQFAQELIGAAQSVKIRDLMP